MVKYRWIYVLCRIKCIFLKFSCFAVHKVICYSNYESKYTNRYTKIDVFSRSEKLASYSMQMIHLTSDWCKACLWCQCMCTLTLICHSPVGLGKTVEPDWFDSESINRRRDEYTIVTIYYILYSLHIYIYLIYHSHYDVITAWKVWRVHRCTFYATTNCMSVMYSNAVDMYSGRFSFYVSAKICKMSNLQASMFPSLVTHCYIIYSIVLSSLDINMSFPLHLSPHCQPRYIPTGTGVEIDS